MTLDRHENPVAPPHRRISIDPGLHVAWQESPPEPPPTLSSPKRAASPDSLAKAGIQIVSATYGSGVSFSDVTDETIKLLNQQPRFYASPDWLRADPTPGWNKALVIIFKQKERRYIFSCGEGGQVDIPLLELRAAEQNAAAAH